MEDNKTTLLNNLINKINSMTDEEIKEVKSLIDDENNIHVKITDKIIHEYRI